VRADGRAARRQHRRRLARGGDRGAQDRSARVVRRREGILRLMAVLDETRYGCQSQTATLRQVLVRAPRAEDCARWRECGWRAEPDAAGLAAEHEAFAAELADFGAQVVYAEEPLPGALDAIYAYDPAPVPDAGAILPPPATAP